MDMIGVAEGELAPTVDDLDHQRPIGVRGELFDLGDLVAEVAVLDRKPERLVRRWPK